MIPEWLSLHRIAVVLAFLVAFAVVRSVDSPRGTWGRTLRSRLLLGVPWGTLVAAAVVVCVYLFVQSGIDDPNRPVVIPFRAWSYFYLEGLLLSGLSHASPGHVTGNLLATLVAGTIAEYAYGHFPQRRGATSFGSLRTHPYVRAFCVVPAAILAGAVLSAVLSIGPVIGISGVVFALWGFALVNYPLGALAALVGTSLVRVVFNALRYPVEQASASPSYGPPSWANIAVQGHAIGLLLGVLAGVYLLRRRGERRHTALVAFTAVLVFSASRSLWAIYWYLGGDRFELYRAAGVVLIVFLALLVAVAVAGRDAPIVPSWAVPNPETFTDAARSASPRTVGVVLLVVGAGTVAGPSILPNLATAADGELPGDPIEVEGYEVTYAENVTDQMVMVVDVETFGRSTRINTSGVIVYNERRGIWMTAVSRGNLEFWGAQSVELGGTGWRETVTAHRSGWNAVGADPAYRVDLAHDGERRTVFVSDPVTAEPTVAGRTVGVAAVEEGFEVEVTHEDETSRAPMPAPNESVTRQGVTLVREDRHVYAEIDDTRVRVLEREQYEGRELS